MWVLSARKTLRTTLSLETQERPKKKRRFFEIVEENSLTLDVLPTITRKQLTRMGFKFGEAAAICRGCKPIGHVQRRRTTNIDPATSLPTDHVFLPPNVSSVNSMYSQHHAMPPPTVHFMAPPDARLFPSSSASGSRNRPMFPFVSQTTINFDGSGGGDDDDQTSPGKADFDV